MRRVWTGILAGLIALGAEVPYVLAVDQTGCKDHPLFARAAGFEIESCDATPFAAHRFVGAQGEEFEVEGQAQATNYRLKAGARAPSASQVIRGLAAGIRRIGGLVLSEDDGNAYLRVEQGGRELHVHAAVDAQGETYRMTVVERPSMARAITVSQLLDELKRAGSSVLPVDFHANRATIKPDSQPILDQLAGLLRTEAELRLSIEGHTDNDGTPQANKALSQQRAEAVVAALAQRGVARARLTAVGWGRERPIADNRSELGRAKNRRIEMVKK